MLQSIDTLIAFVVIVTVASLFVTIFVQMLSALLSLRGKNLANALALTFQSIDPSLGEKAHQLAAKILTDPLLSDSTLTTKDKGPGLAWMPARKGPWSFQNFQGAARLASAIRGEEVYAALRRLQERKESAERLQAELVRANDALKVASGPAQEAAAQTRLKEVTAAIGPEVSGDVLALRASAAGILAALLTASERDEAKARELDELRAIAGAITDAPTKQRLLAAVEEKSAALTGEVEAARVKFDGWFKTAQDRAQQWFQLHTRSLTIVGSFVIAFILQLDAVEVFHFVSTNAAARTALVASAGSVIQKADGALDARGGLIQRIAEAATKPGQAAIDLTGINHTGELAAAVAKRDGAQFNSAEFSLLVRQTTAKYFAEERDRLGDLTNGVNATGFEFIPVGYWRWPAGASAQGSLENIMPHLPGIALFAALLTLGAPYWFNVLKNLASLRPALARSISKEESEPPPQK